MDLDYQHNLVCMELESIWQLIHQKVLKIFIQRYVETTRRDSSLVYGLCANLCFFDTQNPEISQLPMRINTKQKGKQKHNEMTFLLISHQSTHVSEKQSTRNIKRAEDITSKS